MKNKSVHGSGNEFPLDRILFGGSFDPPHNGHFTMLRYVLENGYGNRLDIIPAALSPFKLNDPPASPEHRFRMMEIGVEESIPDELKSRVSILDLEIKRPPPSFTYETCRSIQEKHRDEKIGLLIGSDSFPAFGRWKNSEELLSNHPLLVFMRTGDRPEQLQEIVSSLSEMYAGVKPRITLLDNPWVDCSSSCIKVYINRKEPQTNPGIRKCLSPRLLEYILGEGLFRDQNNEDGAECL